MLQVPAALMRVTAHQHSLQISENLWLYIKVRFAFFAFFLHSPLLQIVLSGLWIRIDLMRIRIRIQPFSLLRIRIQFRIQGFDDQKLIKFTVEKKLDIFLLKNLRPP